MILENFLITKYAEIQTGKIPVIRKQLRLKNIVAEFVHLFQIYLCKNIKTTAVNYDA